MYHGRPGGLEARSDPKHRDRCLLSVTHPHGNAPCAWGSAPVDTRGSPELQKFPETPGPRTPSLSLGAPCPLHPQSGSSRPPTAPASRSSRLARDTGPQSEPTDTPLPIWAGLRGARARARVSPVWGALPLGRAVHVMRRALPARPERGRARAPDPRARACAPSPPPVEPAPGPPGQFPRARSGGGARAVRVRGGARAGRGRADYPSPGALLPAAAAARARAWRLPRATLRPGAGSGLRPPLPPAATGCPGWEA